MIDTLSWLATAATILAALLTASNLGSRITGIGFLVFLVGSLAWLGLALLTGQPALGWTNAMLTLLNLFGAWRWLGRQARVEEGSKAASLASEDRPGEDLFPISMLTRATLRSGGTDLGTCVDAMAGSQGGRIAYVVVSEGGIAGAGETFRRVPWSELQVDGDKLATEIGESGFCSLEPIPRDRWPAW